ncbi:unnamed protein product [Toxocara canis]|uniref:ABC transporter ATP-binding protein n=1 Tax=Toxocara canis TaxID=6265 RepID=A0A183U5U5_TOXCA|nr:unnamed protein product [Toxocara canis]
MTAGTSYAKMAASSSNEVTTSSSRRNAMNGMGKLRLYVDAVEHFKKNDRIKVYDMQVIICSGGIIV